jgi:hypothetical protein
VLAAAGDFEGAATAFQEALKYALILKAPREQSVVFGNLAQAAFSGGDLEKVRITRIPCAHAATRSLPGAARDWTVVGVY